MSSTWFRVDEKKFSRQFGVLRIFLYDKYLPYFRVFYFRPYKQKQLV